MILLAVLLLAVLTVPLAGGRIGQIADLPLRWGWAIVVSIGLQIITISFLPDRFGELPEWLHILSYVFAALFILANIRIPGMALLGLGALCNAIAIVANRGVMPASPSALEGAGFESSGEGFANSTALEDPNLLFLGDIFYVPDSVPILDNVFSVGDVLIAVGVFLLVHASAGSTWIKPWMGRVPEADEPVDQSA